MACIDACRQLDAAQPQSAEPEPEADAAESDALQSEAGASGVGAPCPVGPFPCERVCWELDALFGRGEPIIGAELNTASAADLAAIGEPYMRCAHVGAAECQAEAAAGSISSSPVSWTGLFFECGGLPAGLDLSD